jgi:hypothetical protein
MAAAADEDRDGDGNGNGEGEYVVIVRAAVSSFPYLYPAPESGPNFKDHILQRATRKVMSRQQQVI